MILCILRHGKAPSTVEAGVEKDKDRPLSEAGRQAVRKMAGLLQEKIEKEKIKKPLRILTSPLLRAVQTAEIVKSVHGGEPETFEPLSGIIPASDLWKAVSERFGGEESLLLVGHQPQLGELVSHLAGSYLEIKSGGLVVLEVAGGKGTVQFHQNP